MCQPAASGNFQMEPKNTATSRKTLCWTWGPGPMGKGLLTLLLLQDLFEVGCIYNAPPRINRAGDLDEVG